MIRLTLPFLFVFMHYASIAQTITNYTTEEGLLSNNTNCITIDEDDNIWVGTQSGVSQFNGELWTNYTKDVYPGMADNTILSIYASSSTDVWIGTDFGTSVFDGTSWTTYTEEDGIGNDKILCIAEDKDANIYLGTNSGMAVFDGNSWISYGTSDGLPFGGVNSITLHGDGTLWLGTGLGGIAIFDGTSFSTLTEEDGLISDKIRAIDFDNDGNIWVATADGITFLNADESFNTNYTRVYELPGTDTLNPIEDIKVGSDGVVWAGVYVDYLVTEGAVCGFNGNWIEFDVEDGLVGPVVRSIDIESDNSVWVATSTGVSKIADHFLSTEQLRNSKSINAYPNPSSGLVHLNLDQTNDEIQQVKVLNLLGEEVITEISKSIQITLDLSKLDNGQYIIQINDSESSVTTLVVKH